MNCTVLRLSLLVATTGMDAASVQIAAPLPLTADVVPVELSRPIYPPIAVAARISGDVEVQVRVRPDGTVEAAVAVDAPPPLLLPAALAAARASRFICKGCGDHAADFSILYKFRQTDYDTLLAGDWWLEAGRLGRQSRLTIVSRPSPQIIYYANVSYRSAQCLYLWRCRWRSAGRDAYQFPVRSWKCGWLWKCAWRRYSDGD